MRERRQNARMDIQKETLRQPRANSITERPQLDECPSNENAPSILLDSALGPAEKVEALPLIFYGLDELFKDSGLGDAFHSSASFRTDIRNAMRADFGMGSKDKLSSVMGDWRHQTSYDQLTKTFESNQIDLTGPVFVSTLTSLLEDRGHQFGSWIDIRSRRDNTKRSFDHSWHQDSGLDQFTAMVGFPPCDDYSGIGVWSHVIKLRQRLPPPISPGPRVFTESFAQEYVVRPAYCRGREIMVYND